MNIPHHDWTLANVTLKSCTIKLQERKPTNVLKKTYDFLELHSWLSWDAYSWAITARKIVCTFSVPIIFPK